MPVSDFECQIARGQIGRYLEGSALSSQAMRGLEEHIAECSDCKGLVADRRAALLGQLGETPTHAVASVPKETNPLLSALRARSEEEEESAPKPRTLPRYTAAPGSLPKIPAVRLPAVKFPLNRSLVLATLLALVLVAMSYLSRAVGGHGALGPKAATAFASPPAPTVPLASKPLLTESAKPALAQPAPVVVRVQPALPESKPKATQKAPKAKAEKKPKKERHASEKDAAPKKHPASEEDRPTKKHHFSEEDDASDDHHSSKKHHRDSEDHPSSKHHHRDSEEHPKPKEHPEPKKPTTPSQPKKTEFSVRVYGPDGRPLNP